MVPRRSIDRASFCFATLFAISLRAAALDAEQVFVRASPSVVTVETFDATGRRIGLGSGVVVAAGEIATNCHVLQDGVTVLVKKEGRSAPASVHFSDKSRDLCQLQASQAIAFTRPVVGVVAMEDLHVGRRVYAIGAPRGLELTLSDGLISGIRQSATGSIQLIQTTAPVSPGSSGGGLFDQEARLVGITTFILKESQNLNFAIPASWVSQLPSRPADLTGEGSSPQAQEHAASDPSRARPQTLGYENAAAAARPDARDYAQSVQDKIQRLISYPSERASQLRAEFALSVMASGWPARVALVQSSGDSGFDAKARAAIVEACPLHDPQRVQFEGVRNVRIVLRAVAVEQVQSKGR